MTIPYTFAGATTAIPLAQLDANFASPITLGNVAMTLSNTYTSIGNLTLTNATISSISGGSANAVVTLNSSGAFTSNATAFSLTSTGVGIGTSTPLAVGGATLQVQNSTVAAIIWSDGTRTGELLASSSANITVGSRSAHSLLLATNDTPRMTIDTSGNIAASNAILTIGDNSRTVSSSTTTGAIVCGGGLGVWSTINAGGSGNFSDTVSVFSQNPSTTQQGILFRNTFNTGASIFSTGAATTNAFITWRNGNGDVGSIVGNGSGINYNTTSDYRLKENVAPMTGALVTVAKLKPVTYNWKADGADGQGFIAHELEEIFPDAVSGKKDGVDAEGNPEYQGIDTSYLVATLTAAIQELNAKVTALEAKVGAK